MEPEVYEELWNLKYEYRETSMNDVIKRLLHEAGIEPFDEVDYDE